MNVQKLSRFLFQQLYHCVPIVFGAAMGVCLILAIGALRLHFGDGWELNVGVALAACIACGLAPMVSWGKSSTMRQSILFCGLVATVNLSPWFLSLIDAGLSQIPQESLVGGSANAWIICSGAVLCLTPAFLCVLGLLRDRGEHARIVTGVVAAWWVAPATTITWFSTGGLLVATTCLGLLSLLSLSDVVRSRLGVSTENADPVSTPANVGSWTAYLLSGFVGSGLVIALHMTQQLIPHSMVIEFGFWGSVLCGVAVVIAFRSSSWLTNRIGPRSDASLFALAAGWTIALMAGFGFWTECALWISAWVSTTSLILAFRIGLLAVLVAPLGMLWGARIKSLRDFDQLTLIGLCTTVSMLATWCWNPSPLQLTYTLVGLSLACAAASAVLTWRTTKPAFRLRSWNTVGGTLCAVALLGMFFINSEATRDSEKILFSTPTFLSLRRGVERRELAWLDDGRELESRETVRGRLSLWRHRGNQVVIRENGLPLDFVTTDLMACPRAASEVAPSLLPLVLHPQADHVLVLGGHPSTVQTCSAFPLQTVTVWEQDESMLRIMEKVLLDLDNESTITTKQMNPRLAFKAQSGQQYDVIISPHVSLLTADGTSLLTKDFYRSVQKHLTPTGIFSQRIPYYDLGPKVVRQIMAAMQDAFPNVLALESVSGELVFMGSLQETSFVDEDVVDRLQLPQARFVMSTIGWDWSIPMSRGALGSDEIQKLLGESAKSTSLQLVCALPVEIMRWGNKSTTTREALSEHGQSLGAMLGEIPEAQDISQRIQDIQLAQNVLIEHPDQFWAYRSVLKKQLKERPRTALIQVNGLKHGLHPEDQRRKDYLVALGEAATRAAPTEDDIQAVTKFTNPTEFDPLVNHFVHHEVALLLERAEDADREAELLHRLHAIYYAPPQDRSVAIVCRAMNLLCEQESDAHAFDQLNGLMRVMQLRWATRFQDPIKEKKYEPLDTERSIEAIRDSLKTMDDCYADAGLSSEEWSLRRGFLERELLRPLKRHRSAQLSRYGT